MTAKKELVKDALENLSKKNFKRFKALVDRRGDIRVAKNKLQDKDFMDVTDILVSAFTEDEAPAVVSELLRSIKCADEAKKLDEKIAEHKSSASKATIETKTTKRKRAVLDALEDLSEENLIRFNLALVDRRGDIRVAFDKVHNKKPMEVTDVLVSAFTEDGAPAVVSELLRSIKCADEAKNLDEQIAKHFPKSSASKATAAAAGAVGETTCSSKKHFVDKHRTKLIERVTNINPILDLLLEKEIIQDRAYEEIHDTMGNQEKMTEIYKQALKSGICAKDIFFEILKEKEPFLVQDLEEKA